MSGGETRINQTSRPQRLKGNRERCKDTLVPAIIAAGRERKWNLLISERDGESSREEQMDANGFESMRAGPRYLRLGSAFPIHFRVRI